MLGLITSQLAQNIWNSLSRAMLARRCEVGVLLVDVVAVLVPVLESVLALLQQVEPGLGALRLDRLYRLRVELKIIIADIFLDDWRGLWLLVGHQHALGHQAYSH